jgi:hypothetical protein
LDKPSSVGQTLGNPNLQKAPPYRHFGGLCLLTIAL